MRKVFANATKDDLNFIIKELLEIKINYSSFTVIFQDAKNLEKEETIDVNEYIFPLRLLKQFFAIHSRKKSPLVHRSNVCLWSPTYNPKEAVTFVIKN